MTRRDCLRALGGAAVLLLPAGAESATLLRGGNLVSLRCLGKALDAPATSTAALATARWRWPQS